MLCRTLKIAYLHFGTLSGVTDQIRSELSRRGHTLYTLAVPGPLEPRNPFTRRPQLNAALLKNLCLALGRYGRRGYLHRWNTPYAWDFHTRRAAALIEALPDRPDLVLQNGALFAPGLTRIPLVLVLDHTRALTLHRGGDPAAGLPEPLDYGPGWFEREKRLYEQAALLTTFSRRVARSLEEDYGIGGEKVRVVGAGANVMPERPRRSPRPNSIVFIGKDFRRKGGLVLLKAFEEVRASLPDATLTIIGPKERLKLPEGARQLGFIPAHELPAHLSEASVFVLPTLREPFGLAFLDAMACALPCIGTGVDAVSEIITHGETGLIVPPGDVLALSRSLLALLPDVSSQLYMGQKGRARVEEYFRWDLVMDRFESALGELFPPLALDEGKFGGASA